MDKVEPDDSTSKWQVATANGHTCDAGCDGGDREHAPKRARTSAVDSTSRQLATGPRGREHRGIDSVIDGAVNAAVLASRVHFRQKIRDAIRTRSVILLSYGDKPAALIRPTSWATEPYTFWAKYVLDKAESATTYSLSVAKINDCVSFDA